MKYGMNLLLWTADVTDEHQPVLEMLKRLGYDGVEVPIFDSVPEKFAKLGQRLDDLGLERTAVTVRTPSDNPASPDAEVRAQAVSANKLAIDCCQALGAKLLCGPFHSALGEFSGHTPTDDERKWSADVLRVSAEHAQTCDVTLALEYLNRFECYLLNSAADTVALVEMVGHPSCRLMFDTFHANIEEKSFAEAIRTCAPFLAHVHISENDRSTPGTGNIPWAETFDTLKAVNYDGWLMVEAFGLALPALAAATKIWRRMFDSEDTLSEDALRFLKEEWGKRA